MAPRCQRIAIAFTSHAHFPRSFFSFGTGIKGKHQKPIILPGERFNSFPTLPCAQAIAAATGVALGKALAHWTKFLNTTWRQGSLLFLAGSAAHRQVTSYHVCSCLNAFIDHCIAKQQISNDWIFLVPPRQRQGKAVSEMQCFKSQSLLLSLHFMTARMKCEEHCPFVLRSISALSKSCSLDATEVLFCSVTLFCQHSVSPFAAGIRKIKRL